MADESVGEARRRVFAKHKAATRKVSRNYQGKGVILAGSEFDPRVDAAKLKRYNTRQLNAYERRLDAFNDRSVQFVPDSYRKPIPAQDFAAFKQVEKQLNRRVAGHFAQFADLKAPNSDMTIGQQMAATTADFPTADTAVNSPYKPKDKSSTSFKSAEALRKTTAAMRKQMNYTYRKKLIDDGRDQLRQMLAVTGDYKLQKQVDKLSDRQFDVLWNYTKFGNALSLKYQTKSKLASGKRERWYVSILNNESKEAGRFVKWAKKI